LFINNLIKEKMVIFCVISFRSTACYKSSWFSRGFSH
jgi:hypothetical protein